MQKYSRKAEKPKIFVPYLKNRIKVKSPPRLINFSNLEYSKNYIKNSILLSNISPSFFGNYNSVISADFKELRSSSAIGKNKTLSNLKIRESSSGLSRKIKFKPSFPKIIKKNTGLDEKNKEKFNFSVHLQPRYFNKD